MPTFFSLSSSTYIYVHLHNNNKKIVKNLQLKIDSGWRVEAGPTRKYVLMKKPQPDPIQPEFGPWGLNSTRLNPFFHPKNGFNPKNRVGFGRTTSKYVHLKVQAQRGTGATVYAHLLVCAPQSKRTLKYLHLWVQAL